MRPICFGHIGQRNQRRRVGLRTLRTSACAAPVRGPLDAIFEVLRTWLHERISNLPNPADDQKLDTVSRDDSVAEPATVRAEQATPPISGEFGHGQFEDELSLASVEALDLLPTPVDTHTQAIDYLMAALVCAGPWRVAGSLLNSYRPARKKFAPPRLISFPQVSC